jgi:hypothetical protein
MQCQIEGGKDKWKGGKIKPVILSALTAVLSGLPVLLFSFPFQVICGS